MISIDSIHRLLAIADVNRDPYAVASAAASLLAANAQDSFALGHYVKALGALKLTAAAARLTGQGSGGAAGGGVIPWASRARRFAANLRALQLRTPAGAALVEEASRELSAFELHQAGDGNFEVLQVGSGQAGGSVGMFVWMSGIADHKASAGLLQFDRKQTPVPQPVAFDGLGFGWLFMHLCDATARSFLGYSCAVYVCESDPLALAMLLHMHDLQSLIADVRTRWFIGSGTEAVLGHYREELRAHEEWSLPDRFIRGPLRPRAALDLERATAEVQAGREARREQLRSDIERYYAGRSVEDWARRFEEIGSAASGPLRVLGITSRYTTVLQHSMRELQAAAREGGVTFEVAIEPDDQSLENPYLEKIAALKPDLIVQLSRLRCENPNLPGNVPFLSWDQDNLPIMRTAQATASLDALTYVAGHAPVFGYTNLDWPRRNCIFCHAAAATHRYHAGPVNAALREKHACDISYVSNASGTPEQLLEQLRQRWKGSAAHLALFEELAAEVLAKSAAGGGRGGRGDF